MKDGATRSVSRTLLPTYLPLCFPMSAQVGPGSACLPTPADWRIPAVLTFQPGQ